MMESESKAMTLSEFFTALIDEFDFECVVRCKDCKHKFLDDMVWNCPFGLPGGENFFCGYGAKGGDDDDEH